CVMPSATGRAPSSRSGRRSPPGTAIRDRAPKCSSSRVWSGAASAASTKCCRPPYSPRPCDRRLRAAISKIASIVSSRSSPPAMPISASAADDRPLRKRPNHSSSAASWWRNEVCSACANAPCCVTTLGPSRNVSLKLTQLGLDVDTATAIDNVRKILERAEPAGFFVRIDMEGSAHTEPTLEIVETLWHHGYHQIGAVLQAALLRSERDLERLNALGIRVRLVKGAYREPKGVAWQNKADVDAAFARMLQTLLTAEHYPAIATHDPTKIRLARDLAQEHQIPTTRFEFQMLYGVRRDLQTALVAAGYRVRVYVPFGRDWFPYFMRRLGERPANAGFVLRAILSDRATSDAARTI